MTVPHSSSPPQDSTAILIALVRGGDNDARAELIERYLPALHRLAHGRLPVPARGAADTNDLVQITLLKALNRLGHFEYRREGAFLAYLRQILVNQIRDEARRSRDVVECSGLESDLVCRDATPLQQAMGHELLEAYDAALSSLRGHQRQAVILRVEFGFDYARIAEALGCSSANAARLVVSRALIRLASRLRRFSNAR